jgi:hypothetical protein
MVPRLPYALLHRNLLRCQTLDQRLQICRTLINRGLSVSYCLTNQPKLVHEFQVVRQVWVQRDRAVGHRVVNPVDLSIRLRSPD